MRVSQSGSLERCWQYRRCRKLHLRGARLRPRSSAQVLANSRRQCRAGLREVPRNFVSPDDRWRWRRRRVLREALLTSCSPCRQEQPPSQVAQSLRGHSYINVNRLFARVSTGFSCAWQSADRGDQYSVTLRRPERPLVSPTDARSVISARCIAAVCFEATARTGGAASCRLNPVRQRLARLYRRAQKTRPTATCRMSGMGP
jgi:hypothetical protein